MRLRAERLGVADTPVRLASASSVRDIIAALDSGRGPDLVVIDSIQTMYLDTLDSAPGTVSQVRGAAQELIGLAKRRGIVVVLVGHVTKEGLIAGPRVLEHMVDTVLYFEGERGHQFRILRAVKNRFGATDEIGVFEMGDRGLAEVPNPSALFLADRAVADPASDEPARSRVAHGRRGGVRRHRGHAAGAGRGAGAGRAVAARHAAPRGGRLGRDAAGDDHGRARRALRPVGRPQRHLPEHRRRVAHRRAGGRSRGRGGAGLGADRDPGAAPTSSCSARSRCRAGCGRSRMPMRGSRKRPSSAFAEAWVPVRPSPVRSGAGQAGRGRRA